MTERCWPYSTYRQQPSPSAALADAVAKSSTYDLPSVESITVASSTDPSLRRSPSAVVVYAGLYLEHMLFYNAKKSNYGECEQN